MQVTTELQSGAICVASWITDLLPDELGVYIEPMMAQGADAMKNALERPA